MAGVDRKGARPATRSTGSQASCLRPTAWPTRSGKVHDPYGAVARRPELGQVVARRARNHVQKVRHIGRMNGRDPLIDIDLRGTRYGAAALLRIAASMASNCRPDRVRPDRSRHPDHRAARPDMLVCLCGVATVAPTSRKVLATHR